MVPIILQLRLEKTLHIACLHVYIHVLVYNINDLSYDSET